MFFIAFEHSEVIYRQMLDIINDMRPTGVSANQFIKIRRFPANPPISARFEQIPNAETILSGALMKSYDVPTATLDLSNWRSNMTLTEAGMKMELVKGEHMALLVRILCNFPIEAMQGLNLSNNNLRNLQQMVPLLKKVPNLKELILTGNNMIRSWDDLKVNTINLVL